MTTSHDRLREIFWTETSEYLEVLNRLVLALEVADSDTDTEANLREVARVAHSLKGAARSVGEDQIESLAHQMEGVFERALEGRLVLTPAVCDVLYDSLDLIQLICGSGSADPEAVRVTITGLEALAAGASAPIAPPPPIRISSTDEMAAIRTTTILPHGAEETVRVSLGKVDSLMGQTSELLLARMRSEQRRRDVQAALGEHRRWRRLWRQARPAYIRAARRLRESEQTRFPDAAPDPALSEGTADLHSLLDFLEATQQHMTRTGRNLQELNRLLAQDNLHLLALVDTLQAEIASVRMLPFETILGGFQRLVRDLARDTGKMVSLEIEGAEIELDKHVLELLKDPLMHILRNAVDHGIELPEARLAAGKPPAGTITLGIAARSNDIEIIVTDDGAGINPETVRQRAQEAGLLPEADTDLLSNEAITALIFEPGFSTARQVTAVSGRGVGLDVVRQRVEALRGRLWVETRASLGTTFHLIVPVSLSRIRCLLARVGTERYAIPLATVTRIITVTPEEVFQVESRPMIRVDERPLPLVHLASVLERPAAAALTADSPVLILHSTEQRHVAFIIDELLSEEELVLKNLGEELSAVPNVAGAAILGTGEVIIVLQTSDLVKNARRARSALALPEAAPTTPEARQPRILVIDDSLTTRTLEKTILETAGYHVQTAASGEEALQALRAQPFDVIVSDVQMPAMNGFELTRRIKADAGWRHIPVILVTSLESPADRERGLEAGADAYLIKSRFDQDELLQVIGRMV